TRTTFSRAFAPRTIETLRTLTPARLAIRRQSAVFARPSTGGAVTGRGIARRDGVGELSQLGARLPIPQVRAAFAIDAAAKEAGRRGVGASSGAIPIIYTMATVLAMLSSTATRTAGHADDPLTFYSVSATV